MVYRAIEIPQNIILTIPDISSASEIKYVIQGNNNNKEISKLATASDLNLMMNALKIPAAYPIAMETKKTIKNCRIT